jgi:2C-methyl-D-erythritol 2,4-cyclodiphosphate synthase
VFDGYMPIIRIEYDDATLSHNDADTLSHALCAIITEVTGIKDVFVYCNTAQIKVQIAPIEVWVEMSAEKIQDTDALKNQMVNEVKKWKESSGFAHPINFTLIPMHWKVEIGI